ncbi:eukaryotic translation initiation factor 4E1 [Drosophila grimshawi]|uniref:eIF-4F 25 kDa subunit n=1 Tax=Drosophila grimshawi TaxID=7222 RepID=B4JKT7_DROGR|nr:eukaryotic translation initiation factor 4E1 [Drosophila grimshawi]XP_032594284.1 eukaryotic translation initiation factor 4E1 [Drosophila grimshawi]EDW00190.1 GH12729 [Drosophila grimshawi]
MKNFANPRTMFKSCSNNDDFSTQPVQSDSFNKSGNKMVPKPVSFSGSHKSNLNAECRSNDGENASSQESSARLQVDGYTAGMDYIMPLGRSDPSDGAGAVMDSDEPVIDSSETEQLPSEPHHPLQNEWTLWYLEIDRTKNWEEMLHEVFTFNTVENFWSLIHHIKTPSEIKMGSDYCLFKKGIRPMWEDEANVKGGRWVININKINKNSLDNIWLDTMMMLIGESCECSQELCGAVVNTRIKNSKISIWTANGSDEAAVLEIGGKLRDGLHIDSSYELRYQLHTDNMANSKSVVKTIYTC